MFEAVVFVIFRCSGLGGEGILTSGDSITGRIGLAAGTVVSATTAVVGFVVALPVGLVEAHFFAIGAFCLLPFVAAFCFFFCACYPLLSLLCFGFCDALGARFCCIGCCAGCGTELVADDPAPPASSSVSLGFVGVLSPK